MQDGHYRFSDAAMGDIQQAGARQLTECNEIWSDVIRRIEGLFPEGEIDSGLQSVLSDRNDNYVRKVEQFGENLGLQNTAMERSRNIALEGGEAMRRAAGR
ncbi:hypothetical protein [Streptomyces sulphureus]|uniref:hypothetical protein n=1 Tax=Streptomyces sulphureus TaxID=47758 RepID=UPI00037B757C|nr:hypothetical protein [Streptomyces sulphureus]